MFSPRHLQKLEKEVEEISKSIQTQEGNSLRLNTTDSILCCKRRKMADMPDDDEPETFIQKAVRVGLIAIPLMMYVSWAHKKFVPCPRVKCQSARSSLFKTSIMKGKRKSKKGKCQDPRADKQEHKKGKFENSCKDSKSARKGSKSETCRDLNSCEPNHQDQLSWLCEINEKDIEPNGTQSNDLKSSAKECCKSLNKKSNPNQKNCKQTEAYSCESNTQSETISPEAFDKLFEQHFQKCVDDFKQHKQRLEKELDRLKQDCESNQESKKPEVNKNGNYLECLADLNMDKDFECDPNFHSRDSDAPYVVKDYKCKGTKGTAANGSKTVQNETSSYLKCLTDLNMDKHFEEKNETQGDFSKNLQKNECCPSSKVDNKTEKSDDQGTSKKGPHAWKTQPKQEEICENEAEISDQKFNSTLEEYNSYINVKDDCGCDPHFNTKDTDKYGAVKGEPCANGAEREDKTDEDALKDFWHACGPPKGLRTGCRAKECTDPCENKYQPS